MKSRLKVRAIKLRKKGLSYSEIREHLPIAKTTLSLWLRDIQLTKKQKERLKQKGGQFQHLACAAHRRKRIEKTKRIVKKARSEIKASDKNTLHIIGVVLYWAEGSKQKAHSPSVGVIFSNTDLLMVRIYIKWLKECLELSDKELVFEIYIHESYKKSQQDLIKYWSRVTGFPTQRFDKIRLKKNKVKSYRKNRGDNYWGVFRIRVRKSTDLNRKISGWIEGVCLQCGVV